MAEFNSKLSLEWIDGHDWKVQTQFEYTTDISQIGTIVVPAGFVTDFASIPRGLWNLFPPTGKYGPAAVIHDFLYRDTKFDRELCDQVFEEAMEVLKVNFFARKIIYRAVRMFGGYARKGNEDNFGNGPKTRERYDPTGPTRSARNRVRRK